MAELFTLPARATDSNGNNLPGAKLYFYATGTTTPQAAYTSSALSTPHANPVVADSGGRFAPIYLNPALTYRAVLKDADEAITVYDIDPANQLGASVPTVSVKDFGALGDDSANDTAAFVAAAATGKPVVIPSGTYRVSGVTFTARVYFQGGKIRRTGGTLAFNGGIEAPVEQIFLDTPAANITVNKLYTPEGWVDWFGIGVDAIETCHKVFNVNRFGPHDYYTDRTIVLDQSYREVIGCYGTAEGGGGTRIIMIGSAAADQPIIRVGTLNTSAVLSCARRLNIYGINTIRDGAPNPAASGRREDQVPGWLVAGLYESVLEKCFDFGSAIHFKVYGTVGCTLKRCAGARPYPGASNGHPDTYTAFVVGGYAASFGFVGANASITIEDCGTAGGVGNEPMGLYLYGYIGDTWVRKFEDSQTGYGIYVDGRDASGAVISDEAAHQDVRITECVLDAHTFNCLTIRDINVGGHITLDNNYMAMNGVGDAVLVQNCVGAITFGSADMLLNPTLNCYGIRITTSKRVIIEPGVMIRDARVGVRAESCDRLRISPTIRRKATGGTNGVELAGVGRSFIAPMIEGDIVGYDYGIVTDVATNYSEFNLTCVNPGTLTTGSATRQIWHNGATWGGGSTFGNNNVATGVLN